MISVEQAVDTARRAAEAGAGAAMAFFGTDVVVERKADQSPVTIADRAAESAILDVLRTESRGTAILTEESGAHAGGQGSRWIVDPIDGTRGFTRGAEYWGPLIALEAEGEIVAGALALPALGRVYWAGKGLGCYRDGVLLRVSGVSRWKDAVLSVGELPGLLSEPHGAGVRRLIDSAFSTRCYGDLGGCTMVLEGRADVWLEAGVQVWDVAPLRLMLAEAGGRFTDLAGHCTIESEHVIGSNELLHDHVLQAVCDLAASR